MRAMIAALILALSGPVQAQIPGVRFGQTITEVQAVIGDTAPVAVTSHPGAQMIFQSKRYVAFCDGRAISMQVEIGHSLNDFAAEVEEETARSGVPSFLADSFRTSEGEMSTVTVRWNFPAYKLEIGMFQDPAGLRVTRTVTALDAGCMPDAD